MVVPSPKILLVAFVFSSVLPSTFAQDCTTVVDCAERLAECYPMPDGSADCCTVSPAEAFLHHRRRLL